MRIHETVKEEPNPHGIEVGKQYYFRYLPSNGPWEHGICERITKFGHPWIKGTSHNGIISPGLYEVQEVAPNKVEEEMYTKEDVYNIATAWARYCRGFDDMFKALSFNEWFDENIK